VPASGPPSGPPQPQQQLQQPQSFESIGKVGYVGVLKLSTGFTPPKSCSEHLRSDMPGIMPEVNQIDFITQESVTIAQDRLQALPPTEKRLSPDQAVAIAAYTYDLGFNSQTDDGRDNFFEALNKLLRQRNSKVMMVLRPYLTYLMQGLEALPPWKGTVYRGVPAEALDIVRKNYSPGKDIHWSSFTSTAALLSKAQQFAQGPGGVIFVVNVVMGRCIVNYSAIPDENEILLSPNSRFVVTSDLQLGSDGYYYIHMQQRSGEGFVF